MTALAALLLAVLATNPVARETPRGFVLAGEAVSFDAELRPRFTSGQISSTAEATRVGFERWTRTEEGRAIIRRFLVTNRTVLAREDTSDPSLGNAPQPGFLTLLASDDPEVHKQYELIVNPEMAAQYRNETSVDLGLPRSAADAMALAWAAEMLHIDFYAEGIALPHHDRKDFRQRWLAVAAQLGLPAATHGEERQNIP